MLAIIIPDMCLQQLFLMYWHLICRILFHNVIFFFLLLVYYLYTLMVVIIIYFICSNQLGK